MEEIQDRLGHHRRSAEAERRPAYREERPPPRRAYSVMLLEVGVARISRARSRSLPRVAGAQPTPRMAHPAHTARTHEIGLGLVARRIKIWALSRGHYLVYVLKPRFSSKYSDMLRSPQKLKLF